MSMKSLSLAVAAAAMLAAPMAQAGALIGTPWATTLTWPSAEAPVTKSGREAPTQTTPVDHAALAKRLLADD